MESAGGEKGHIGVRLGSASAVLDRHPSQYPLASRRPGRSPQREGCLTEVQQSIPVCVVMAASLANPLGSELRTCGVKHLNCPNWSARIKALEWRL